MYAPAGKNHICVNDCPFRRIRDLPPRKHLYPRYRRTTLPCWPDQRSADSGLQKRLILPFDHRNKADIHIRNFEEGFT